MPKKKMPKVSAEESFEHYIEAMEESRRTPIYDLNSYEDKKSLERFFKYNADFGLLTLEQGYKGSALVLSDGSKPFVKKRLNIVMQMLSTACEKYSKQFPNLCIEEEFVAANATFNVMTYDVIDVVENITLAIALWILDELELRGMLNKVLPLLPDEDEIQGIRLPEYFEDSCFDASVIMGVMYLIHNRNDDIESKKTDYFKPYINDSSLKRAERKHEYHTVDDPQTTCETNRQKFDYIMSLIHPAVVERVTKRFEEKQWEIFERYLKCVNKYRTEELQLIDEIYEALVKQKKLFPLITKIREDREHKAEEMLKGRSNTILLAKQPSIDDIFDLHPGVPSFDVRRAIERSAEEQEFDRLIDVITSKEERRAKLKGVHDAAAYFVGSPAPDGNHQPDDIPDDAVPDVSLIHQLEISNPYETCFAFLYLLDSGSPMPWLAPLGVMVLETATRLLPWHKFAAYNEDEIDDDEGVNDECEDEEDIDEDEELEETDEDESRESDNEETIEDSTPIDWIEEEAKIYKPKYNYPKFNPENGEYTPDNSTILNFPQFVYSQTQVAIPRNVFRNSDMAEYYMIAGFEEKEAKLFEKYITLAEAGFTKTSTAKREGTDDDYEDDETESESKEEIQTEQIDIDGLKQEIRRLKDEIKKSHDEKRGIQRETETLKAEKEELLKQLSELRTMIRGNKTRGNDSETKQIPEVSFPYSAKGRYVVFGGHDSWARAIKPLLENVRFIDADSRPNVGLILHADTVWVQSNAIGHSDYYKILDVVRTHDIKLEYFSYASAEKCAEQLALYDLEHN